MTSLFASAEFPTWAQRERRLCAGCCWDGIGRRGRGCTAIDSGAGRVTPVVASSGRPPVLPSAGQLASQFRLSGDEATAQLLMSRELEQFKAELDAEAKKASGPKAAKIFTLWLYPPGVSLP